ncbi:hypothetical protein MmiAt1_00760 [Methanimicrococcus sp. At1]|uniref:DUF6440 domain-containing protein n=1 Tax=Methanimicrococcus hacksteinii TaxID=3028293 RepID=A0ABU3VMJ4_9EURY|nr:DUF6440 family protein [Methanimicrococcus sp. At1]MDV0444549.1 hypothetical protein [Methanimicrococcus sp. At1]
MKKIIMFVLIASLLITPAFALSDSSNDDVFVIWTNKDPMMTQNVMTVIAHNETGVCYLIISNSQSISVTPMTLENGQPYIYMTPYLIEERNFNAGKK